MDPDEAELQRAIQKVLQSPSRRKLVVAGPGTGKTTLFKELLKNCDGEADDRLVLTFINNLRNDLETALAGLARVSTLHAYCMGLLHAKSALRAGLTPDFRCVPGLAHLIAADWEHIEATEPPHFVGQMRKLEEENEIKFYLARGNYYDSVDFDDCVFRAYRQLALGSDALNAQKLVLIDEYQDFNALEAGLIGLLADKSPILIVGDDDQALYSQLRDSSWDYIRALHDGREFEVFELPFCMRCPKVIVDAVNDVLGQAKKRANLKGRIEKPYKHFPPAKGADSKKYPTIALVFTSVQRENANYMGQYVADLISRIPAEEIEAATKDNYPALLVIVAKPYRTQIVAYLEAHGYSVDTKIDSGSKLKREDGLEILKTDPGANVGWRIVLESEPANAAAAMIKSSAQMDKPLVDLVPHELRERILAEVDQWEPTLPAEESGEGKEVEEGEGKPLVRVTSFEGAKGLSAQHVVIAGLHDGEIPHDPANIDDIEICRFLVGLTRTRKRCYLLHTGRFAQNVKAPSTFLSWIGEERYERVRVDAQYWKKKNAK
ncbi:MAG: UvrD-helicase domain-containing protein [Gemmatimonadaceae bacterium]